MPPSHQVVSRCFNPCFSVGTLSKALDEASFEQVEAFLSSKREGRQRLANPNNPPNVYPSEAFPLPPSLI
jgi:hypothetical protein